MRRSTDELALSRNLRRAHPAFLLDDCEEPSQAALRPTAVPAVMHNCRSR